MNLKKTAKTLSLSLLACSLLVACGSGISTQSDNTRTQSNNTGIDYPSFDVNKVEKGNIKYKPSGDIASTKPTFLWHAKKDATDYKLVYFDITDKTWGEHTLTDKEAGCSINYGCTYKYDGEIKVGAEKVWWVKAKIKGAWADWSQAHVFKVSDEAKPASNTWNNTNVKPQKGRVSASFKATPADNNIDSVIGFSKNEANKYEDLGIMIRFADTGMIDARDGDGYDAITSIPYKADTEYSFRLNIDFEKHNYTIYVTPKGENEILLGTDFNFRKEQENMKSINSMAEYTEGGSITVDTPKFEKISDSSTPKDSLKYTDMIHQDDFEGHALNTNLWEVTWYTTKSIEGGISPEVVTDKHRTGKSALKVRAEKGANGIANYTRTEITARRNDKKWGRFTKFFDHGKDYWIGFSVYLPKDWKNDSLSDDVIFQLHGQDGAGGKHEVPLLSLVVSNDKWYWHVSWEKGSTFGEVEEAKDALVKGKWVDFVIHEKFSDSDDGILEIWRTIEGEKKKQIVTRNNMPNSYEKNKGFVRGPQTGIYKWDWTDDKPTEATSRVMYIDSLKVAENASYDVVAPK